MTYHDPDKLTGPRCGRGWPGDGSNGGTRHGCSRDPNHSYVCRCMCGDRKER